jgi:tetratricopeptide (TPR) repeat protein
LRLLRSVADNVRRTSLCGRQRRVPGAVYSRADLLRILHITPRQLANWERIGLVTSAEAYSFADLLELKKVRDLCAMSVRPTVIRESLEAMRKQAAGVEKPLLEAGAWSTKKHRVAFRHDGKLLEPIAGQFLMDFSEREKVVTSTPVPRPEPTQRENEAAAWFARGIASEEDPATQGEAIAAYHKVLEIESSHAAAHINLGTIHYNRQDFSMAEQHYRQAIEADPRYALAYFDLGNVLDETGRVPEAIQTYKTALQLAPTYADAHYNLALAFEKLRQPRKALKHWQAYIKLDTSGPWSVHARTQIKRILQADTLKLVRSRS